MSISLVEVGLLLAAFFLLILIAWNLLQTRRVQDELLKLHGAIGQQGQGAESSARRVEERTAAIELTVRTLDKELRLQQEQATNALSQTLVDRANSLQAAVAESLSLSRDYLQRSGADLREHIGVLFGQQREAFERRQTEISKAQHESLLTGLTSVREQVTASLTQNAQDLTKRVGELTEKTETKLREISGQVEKRLSEGFEKTTATFADIVKRLAMIDEAQKKITELSTNVVSLQEVLTDKRTRGAFGEVQLAGLIRNVLPEQHFSLQHSLSNNMRVDCLLILPAPTGNVCIDAKFPLESFRRMTNNELPDAERKAAERQFKSDVRTHISDIADKYIIAGETADGAMMFIPAEAVFAEIHAHHPDVVEEAQRRRVWMVSPTTLMAVLTTARAVLKDEATRQQIGVIKEHLVELAKDFGRFQERMDKLALHIDQAHRDVKDVSTSAKKISSRFTKIEQVDLVESGVAALEEN